MAVALEAQAVAGGEAVGKLLLALELRGGEAGLKLPPPSPPI